jgi:hypothetical protein
VLAAGIEDTDELCARAIPTFACTVGRSCNDHLPHLLVIATDQHEGHMRANPSEERMDRLLIRSDVRLGTYLGRSTRWLTTTAESAMAPALACA